MAAAAVVARPGDWNCIETAAETTNSNFTQVPLLSPKYVHFYHRIAINISRLHVCVCALCYAFSNQLTIYHKT